MASGDKIQRSQGSFSALLLDGVATGATNDGVWVDTEEYASGTVVALGAATTTVVTVNGHNGVLQAASGANPAMLIAPANNVVGSVIATGAAGAAVYQALLPLPRFVKCAITATGTGTISATLMARKAT